MCPLRYPSNLTPIRVKRKRHEMFACLSSCEQVRIVQTNNGVSTTRTIIIEVFIGRGSPVSLEIMGDQRVLRLSTHWYSPKGVGASPVLPLPRLCDYFQATCCLFDFTLSTRSIVFGKCCVGLAGQRHRNSPEHKNVDTNNCLLCLPCFRLENRSTGPMDDRKKGRTNASPCPRPAYGRIRCLLRL